MVANRKPTGRALSVPAGLALGGALSLAGTLAGSAVTAWLIHAEHLAPEHTGYAVMILLLVSAWMGSALARRKIRRRPVLVCLLSAGVYYGILLLITALFFGGQYHGAGETGLMVLCGSALEILTPKHRKTRAPQRKFRIRNG